MIVKLKQDLEEMNWCLKLNETIRGMVSFSVSLSSVLPFTSFSSSSKSIQNMLQTLEQQLDTLIKNEYVKDELNYCKSSVAFFCEWSLFLQEKLSIKSFETFSIEIPEGGSKPQFCVRRIDRESENSISFKFVKESEKIIVYAYINDTVSQPLTFTSYEDLAFYLFGH